MILTQNEVCRYFLIKTILWFLYFKLVSRWNVPVCVSMSDNFSGSQTFWACCKNGRAINKVIFQQKNFLKKFHVLLDWVLVLTSSASICFFNLPCICTQFLRPIFTVTPFGFSFLKYICILLQIYKDICLPVSFACSVWASIIWFCVFTFTIKFSFSVATPKVI